VVVARGFALRITAALNDTGAGSSSSVGRLRVHASVYERHSLKDHRERVMGWDEGALLRAGVMEINRRDM
jgi:hypothetical protein